MYENNFKLTSETNVQFGITFTRIQAIRDLPNGVKNGDLGGWVSGNALVYGNAWVSGNAQVYGDARVYGNAWVSGNAQVYGNAWVSGNAQVYGNALVYGDARVYGDAVIASVSGIIVLCIAMSYSVTVTKTLVFIGCKIFKTSELKQLTQKKAIELGLPKEYYQSYKAMILSALKIIK